jgi:sulfur-carrier protein
MATIRIPPVLRASVGNNKQVEFSGETLQEVLDNLFERYPTLRQQILTEDGTFSRFINVYVDDQDARYLQGLHTPLTTTSTVTLLPAMAGGQ